MALQRKRPIPSQPDATFDKTPFSKTKMPTSTIDLVSRRKEINTQKYAAGTRPAGGGQGPALDQK